MVFIAVVQDKNKVVTFKDHCLFLLVGQVHNVYPELFWGSMSTSETIIDADSEGGTTVELRAEKTTWNGQEYDVQRGEKCHAYFNYGGSVTCYDYDREIDMFLWLHKNPSQRENPLKCYTPEENQVFLGGYGNVDYWEK